MKSQTSCKVQSLDPLVLRVSLYERGEYLCHWIVTEKEAKQDAPCDLNEGYYVIHATMTAHFWYCLLSYLMTSSKCRAMILNHCYAYCRRRNMSSKVNLRPNKTDSATLTMDYAWNERLLGLVNERSTLDTVMSYLSTLGGAFSSLGDAFPNCAVKAGEISKKQFQVALRLGEEPLIARCRLYFALSLLQQEKFHLAKQLVLQQYILAHKLNDNKLKNMCKGIWAKLRYARKLSKQSRTSVTV